MGLDTYLFRKTKDTNLRILNTLEDKDEYEEVMYWRKAYRIDEFMNSLCGGVENCEYGLITREKFLLLIEWVKSHKVGKDDSEEYYNQGEYLEWLGKLNEIYNNTDWETQEIYYYAWW